jgi:hypothetical protein
MPIQLGKIDPLRFVNWRNYSSDVWGWIAGGGDKNFKFKSNRAMIQQLVKAINAKDYALPEVKGTEKGFELAVHPFRHVPLPNNAAALVSKGKPQKERTFIRTLGAGWAFRWSERLFISAVAQRFDSQEQLLATRTHDLPIEMQTPALSLLAQIRELEKRSTMFLPVAVRAIRKKFPQASSGQIYQAALQLMDQQLMPLLSVIYLYTRAIEMWLNPKYIKRLRVLRAKIEQKLCLLLTGNLNITESDVKQRIKTIAVHVGDLVFALLIGPEDGGPAVIPVDDTTLGPQGASLMFYPAHMQDDIPSTDPVYSHEMGHLFMAIVIGLAESLADLAIKSIDTADDAGKIPWVDAQIEIAPGVKVKSREWSKKKVINQIGELFADLIMMLVSGPEAGAKSFTQFLAGSVGMSGDIDNAPLWRDYSNYRLEHERGTNALSVEMEPHPIDNERLEWLRLITAAMNPKDKPYDRFTATMDLLKEYREKESGTPAPTEIYWEYEGDEDDAGDQLKLAPQSAQQKPFVIRQKLADAIAPMSFVIEAWLDSPMVCLNGLTLRELVCFTPEMDMEKVLLLNKLLKQGVSRLPRDGKHYWLHLIGAAAVYAIYDLITGAGGNPPMSFEEAVEMVNPCALQMMEEATDDWESSKDTYSPYTLPGHTPKQFRLFGRVAYKGVHQPKRK